LSAIYLIRHATPDWTRYDLPYHKVPGPPLTSQGESEAEDLGAFLRQAGVRRIYTSPLERCRRTAEIAGQVAGVEVSQALGLAEWQPGESEAQVRERFLPVWETVLASGNGHGPEPTALVSHGGPIAMLLADLGLEANALAHYRKLFDRNNPLPPAGVWRATRPAPDVPWELSLVYMPEAYKKDSLV
jgi:broad specificity phosphatase PhoE